MSDGDYLVFVLPVNEPSQTELPITMPMVLRCHQKSVADVIVKWITEKDHAWYRARVFHDPQPQGLEGLWGHRYRDDPDRPGKKTLVHQFRVIKRLREEGEVRYVVELGSWIRNATTNAEVLSEVELLGEYIVLYTNEASWHEAAERAIKSNEGIDVVFYDPGSPRRLL